MSKNYKSAQLNLEVVDTKESLSIEALNKQYNVLDFIEVAPAAGGTTTVASDRQRLNLEALDALVDGDDQRLEKIRAEKAKLKDK